MVSVDCQITSDAFLHFKAVITEHMSVVSSPIEGHVSWDDFALLVPVPVDDCSEHGDFGQDGHHIVIIIGPIVGLFHTFIVLVEELAVPLDEKNGQGQHSHRVRLFRN